MARSTMACLDVGSIMLADSMCLQPTLQPVATCVRQGWCSGLVNRPLHPAHVRVVN